MSRDMHAGSGSAHPFIKFLLNQSARPEVTVGPPVTLVRKRQTIVAVAIWSGGLAAPLGQGPRRSTWPVTIGVLGSGLPHHQGFRRESSVTATAKTPGQRRGFAPERAGSAAPGDAKALVRVVTHCSGQLSVLTAAAVTILSTTRAGWAKLPQLLFL